MLHSHHKLARTLCTFIHRRHDVTFRNRQKTCPVQLIFFRSAVHYRFTRKKSSARFLKLCFLNFVIVKNEAQSQTRYFDFSNKKINNFSPCLISADHYLIAKNKNWQRLADSFAGNYRCWAHVTEHTHTHTFSVQNVAINSWVECDSVFGRWLVLFWRPIVEWLQGDFFFRRVCM